MCNMDWFGAVGNVGGGGNLPSGIVCSTLRIVISTDTSDTGSPDGTLTATWTGRS